MIVVTGPTGNTGGAVVEGLRRRGVPFRAMTHTPAHLEALRERGIDAVHGNFLQPDTLRAALDGADAAYLVCTPDERLVTCERNFIDAAREAGVRRLVACGAYAASADSASPNLRMHAEVEQALADSGLDYTVVRPHFFMQTYLWMSAASLAEQGVLSYPAGAGAIPFVDVRDAGAAMLAALLESATADVGHAVLDLTGPEALTVPEMAEILGRAMGREVRYVEMPEEHLDGGMRAMGVPDAPREHVLWCFREQRSGGFAHLATGHTVLGVRLHGFEEFAADFAASATGVATSDFAG